MEPRNKIAGLIGVVGVWRDSHARSFTSFRMTGGGEWGLKSVGNEGELLTFLGGWDKLLRCKEAGGADPFFAADLPGNWLIIGLWRAYEEG